MAEPLKNSFGPDVPRRLAEMIGSVESDFAASEFVDRCLVGYESMELTERARHIAGVLADHLPSDRARALAIVTNALGPEIEETELTGMDGFLYLPLVFFVADKGLDHFEAAMTAQYELTKRFTAEFSIRAFLDRYPDATLARLREWAGDSNVHVRRLVSEGSRPRLPWAPRLRAFQSDPQPVIELLELLKDDPEEYVRRSVANNLNDISKDHPDLVVVDLAMLFKVVWPISARFEAKRHPGFVETTLEAVKRILIADSLADDRKVVGAAIGHGGEHFFNGVECIHTGQQTRDFFFRNDDHGRVFFLWRSLIQPVRAVFAMSDR